MRDLSKYEVMKPNFAIETTEELAPHHKILTIEPLVQGYGHTLGNALRRTLMSSLPGTAITTVKFRDANHHYSTVKSLRNNLQEVMLNLKQVIVSSSTDDEGILRLNVKGPKTVTAADIECSTGFEIINSDQFIVDIVNNTNFEIEMKVETNTGYLAIPYGQATTVGEIMVDAIFSPVIDVSYKVGDAQVGRQTDYDKLIMDIKTNGSITPEEALDQAARILAAQFTRVFEPIICK